MYDILASHSKLQYSKYAVAQLSHLGIDIRYDPQIPVTFYGTADVSLYAKAVLKGR